MNCELNRQSLVDYLDGELSPADAAAAAAHLADCPACREAARNLERSLAVFRAVLQAEPACSPACASSAPLPLPAARSRVRWWAAAAALVLVLGSGAYWQFERRAPSSAFTGPATPPATFAPQASVAEPSFVLHGRGISRSDSLDVKL